MRYGYVRVSSRDQNIARQMSSISDYGIEKKYIFIDRESGNDFERKNYRRMLKKLKAEDEVYVKSIDRLGRIHLQHGRYTLLRFAIGVYPFTGMVINVLT